MSVNEPNTVLTRAVSERRVVLSPTQRLLWLAIAAVITIVLFMSLNLGSNLSYILMHRGLMLTTMLLVAFAASASTVLFQTVTNNRVLTPSIMGFEALFILIQTSLVFVFGVGGIPGIGTEGKFILEALLLILFSALLYRWLFTGSRNNLHLVLLVGIICGTLFRSMAGLMQRLLTPGEFAIVQGRMFATFTRTVPELVALSVGITLVVAVVIWRMRYRFDVLALGRDNAINLGIDYKRSVTVILLLVSILVAISTALVGPLTFLGFMVANLAYLVIRSSQHRLLLPAAFLLGVIALVGGQLVLEHLLDMSGALSVVIEFVGGALFIVLLLRKVSV
ncbi:iron chelate uptake ABC transporter family permease subunit [Pectobacterium cacticida]|uniref:Iron chelate uptake ABC transporter family permease subunit n=1 Tax=Pectobacterium cacticida TaxID=69221 RepID=A0ABZ2G8M6_9GAMM|nr:iron chelate uptake ABC transporter family permease subunit [Pectobacterium cacticida]UYX08226.1 iron chelate uptake ABC transporter family permease subunit [Pectobacterium cacticida]